MTTLERAIETARSHIPVQQKVVKPEYWSRYAIVDHGHRFAVYEERSFAPPEAQSLLPWVSPLRWGGVVVGYVELDGTVNMMSKGVA